MLVLYPLCHLRSSRSRGCRFCRLFESFRAVCKGKENRLEACATIAAALVAQASSLFSTLTTLATRSEAGVDVVVAVSAIALREGIRNVRRTLGSSLGRPIL